MSSVVVVLFPLGTMSALLMAVLKKEKFIRAAIRANTVFYGFSLSLLFDLHNRRSRAPLVLFFYGAFYLLVYQ